MTTIIRVVVTAYVADDDADLDTLAEKLTSEINALTTAIPEIDDIDSESETAEV